MVSSFVAPACPTVPECACWFRTNGSVAGFVWLLKSEQRKLLFKSRYTHRIPSACAEFLFCRGIVMGSLILFIISLEALVYFLVAFSPVSQSVTAQCCVLCRS